MGRGEIVHYWVKGWLSLSVASCRTEQTRSVGIVVARTIVRGIGWYSVGLEISLRKTTLCVVRLETTIVVAGIIVTSRVVDRSVLSAIVATRRSLGGVLYNALLFHERDELIEEVVCWTIELITA